MDYIFPSHLSLLIKLQEFPPTSKLDPKVYGDQSSTIRKSDIESNLDGLTVDEAIFKFDMIFCFDHTIFFEFCDNFAVKFNSFFFLSNVMIHCVNRQLHKISCLYWITMMH